jgi:acyl-CoA thioester hydrolase
MTTDSSPVATDIRVLYGDTDAMGQAYYGNYMRWFESGRAEWFRACGMSYRGLEERGVYLPVIEAHCRYRKPAFYDDTLTIATTFRFSGPARLRFDYEITRGSEEEVLASGYTVHVCVDRERRVLKPPPFLACLLPAQDSDLKDAVPQDAQRSPAHC